MGTESGKDHLDLTNAAYPDPPVDDQVVADVLRRRWETRAKPIALGPAIRKARQLQAHGSVAGLDDALIDVAAAALNTISNLRRLAPSLVRRPRR